MLPTRTTLERPATLLPLTSLRFVAAAAVCLYHVQTKTNWFHEGSSVHWLSRWLFSEGHIGVTFFFMLSGFVLAYNYPSRFATLNRRDLRTYAVARFARIYPLHLLTFLLAFTLYFTQPNRLQLDLVTVASQLTLTQACVPDSETFFGFNGVAWSLSVEACFYAAFPFVLWLCLRKRVQRPAVLLTAAVLVWAAELVAVYYFARSGWACAGWLCFVFPVTRMGEFLLGVIGGVIYGNLPTRSMAMPPSSGRGQGTACEVGVLVLFGLMVAVKDRIPPELRVVGAYSPVFFLMLFVFASQRGLLSTWLSKRPLVLLGEASFALYMTHFILLLHCQKLIGDEPGFPVLIGMGLFAISVLVSVAVHIAIEKPSRTWLMRRMAVAKPREVSPLPQRQAA